MAERHLDGFPGPPPPSSASISQGGLLLGPHAQRIGLRVAPGHLVCPGTPPPRPQTHAVTEPAEEAAVGFLVNHGQLTKGTL